MLFWLSGHYTSGTDFTAFPSIWIFDKLPQFQHTHITQVLLFLCEEVEFKLSFENSRLNVMLSCSYMWINIMGYYFHCCAKKASSALHTQPTAGPACPMAVPGALCAPDSVHRAHRCCGSSCDRNHGPGLSTKDNMPRSAQNCRS